MPHLRWAVTGARNVARQKNKERRRQKQPARAARLLTDHDEEQQLALATLAQRCARPGRRAARLLSFDAFAPIDDVELKNEPPHMRWLSACSARSTSPASDVKGGPMGP
jgi:hypothetical protein